MSSSLGIVTKIKRINLKNFKGFHCSKERGDGHSVDVDADIVIVAGPNGYGKSSFLEAITLLMTRWHDENSDPVRHLISRIPSDKQGEVSRPEPSASIKADVEFKDYSGASNSSIVQWQLSNRGEESEEVNWEAVAEHKGLPVDEADDLGRNPELAMRFCAFFQDKLDLLFDQTASGKTMHEFLSPKPDWVIKAIELLESATIDFDSVKFSLVKWGKRSEAELHQALNEHIESFSNIYENLIGHEFDSGSWPNSPSSFGSDGELSTFAVRVIEKARGLILPVNDKNLPEIFFKVFLDNEQGLIKNQLKIARENSEGSVDADKSERFIEIQRELREIKLELVSIRKKFPKLTEDLCRFSSSSSSLPDVLSILEALRANATRWGKAFQGEEEGQLSEVIAQLSAVTPEAAGKCAETLGNWLKPKKIAEKRIQYLEDTERELTEELKRIGAQRRVAELGAIQKELVTLQNKFQNAWEEERGRLDYELRLEQRRQAQKFIESAIRVSSWMAESLGESDLARSRGITERLQNSANWAMDRFCVVPGLFPLHLNQILRTGKDKIVRNAYAVCTDDGRELVQLSTGQRAQFGVALMVAQNREVSSDLPHRILVLDDVSTAYDLSNLTREALLWRLIAYGEQEERYRRQIFISSHHEDMTNHLLDLLVPPPGHTLRLIRFTDWTPKDGPVIETFNVEATAAADARSDGGTVAAFIQSIQEETVLWQTELSSNMKS